MARMRDVASHICLTAGGVVIGGAVLFILRGGIAYLPCLEGYFFPVSRLVGPPTDIVRDSRQACFTLTLKKMRQAVPETYLFRAEVRQNGNWLPAMNLNAHLASFDNDKSANDKDFDNHATGLVWTRRWCFDMPATVADSQVVRISADAIHQAHPLWKTSSPLGSFLIGTVPQPPISKP